MQLQMSSFCRTPETKVMPVEYWIQLTILSAQVMLVIMMQLTVFGKFDSKTVHVGSKKQVFVSWHLICNLCQNFECLTSVQEAS